jgi:hypothetical protein
MFAPADGVNLLAVSCRGNVLPELRRPSDEGFEILLFVRAFSRRDCPPGKNRRSEHAERRPSRIAGPGLFLIPCLALSRS